MKVYFYVTHTHVVHIVYVGAWDIDFNILLCQYIKAYVYTVYTHMLHISSDVETTPVST